MYPKTLRCLGGHSSPQGGQATEGQSARSEMVSSSLHSTAPTADVRTDLQILQQRRDLSHCAACATDIKFTSPTCEERLRKHERAGVHRKGLARMQLALDRDELVPAESDQLSTAAQAQPVPRPLITLKAHVKTEGC